MLSSPITQQHVRGADAEQSANQQNSHGADAELSLTIQRNIRGADAEQPSIRRNSYGADTELFLTIQPNTRGHRCRAARYSAEHPGMAQWHGDMASDFKELCFFVE